jgi:hypothetical protein
MIFSPTTNRFSPYPTAGPDAMPSRTFIPNAMVNDWTPEDFASHYIQPDAIPAANLNDPLKLPTLTADVARAQWEDYKKRFMPLEDALMNQTVYGNPAIVEQSITAAMPRVDSAINLGQKAQTRRLEMMGQNVTPEARAELDKTWGNQRTLARVDAANQIRQNIAARSRELAFGGTAQRPAIDTGA